MSHRVILLLSLLVLMTSMIFAGCLESTDVRYENQDGDESTDGDDPSDGDAGPDGDQATDGDETVDGDIEPGPCDHLCDCPQGFYCDNDGMCADGADLLGVPFCCDNPGCPENAPCEYENGLYGWCPGPQPDGDGPVDGDSDGDSVSCEHLCDCPQGFDCSEGLCVDARDMVGTVFCCDRDGCPSDAPCEHRDGSYDRCEGSPECGYSYPTGIFCPDEDNVCENIVEIRVGQSDSCEWIVTAKMEGGQNLSAFVDGWDEDGEADIQIVIEGLACSLVLHPQSETFEAACNYCGTTEFSKNNCDSIEENYLLHEWGVNVTRPDGSSEIGGGPARFWGAIPAKPVIYIYADDEMTLDVGVDFASGASTETWPTLSNGQMLEWNGVEVSQGDCQTTATPTPDYDLMEPVDLEIYQLPNWVVDDADCLTHGDTVSKLLFYTGEFEDYQPPIIGTFDPNSDITGSPIQMAQFDLENTSDQEVGPIILLYRDTLASCMDPSWCPVIEADVVFGVLEKLAAGESKMVLLPVHHLSSGSDYEQVSLPDGWDAMSERLEEELALAGLFSDEIGVFMRTWDHLFFGLMGEDSFFTEPDYENGAFLIHFWPDEHTELMLPLSLDPAPTEQKRAMVQYQKIAHGQSHTGLVTGTVTLEEWDEYMGEIIWSGPASGATVSAWQGQQLIAAALTGDDGEYSLSLPEGIYDITAERREWESGDKESDVAVFAGQETIVDLTLLSEAMVDKPNLYLYPEETSEVDVLLTPAWGCEITQSIPEYGDGWHVTVEPSGLIDGQYTYLFYESEIPRRFPLGEGWSVPAGDLAEFFEQTLTAYGFTALETFDFVDYWTVHLPVAPYYGVYPITEATFLDPLVSLDIQPIPDSLFRLWLVISPEEQAQSLPVPAVTPMTRIGFTAAEWGVIVD